ncbi:hypothetical protein CVT26_002419 [Gymnopilus dilepis]|uniref:Uncharacterized protein n=1 Tax=Gymnopilus dilepis TaxID=231916 RepID=A0A409X514_9AGAR|nr:hypothetical protein CVT26_002419 [Gymnopilus dilepis]
MLAAALPPNHNIRLFLKDLSPLSRITGTEHDQICRDIRPSDNLSNVKLYPIHTSKTLDDALERFHANRDIFISLEFCSNLNMPKLHYMGHYRNFIKRFGTANNVNTEYTERLYIDLAKDAYRASNHKDEYPQMTAWLDRKEKVLLHDKYIHRHLEASANSVSGPAKPLPSLILCRDMQMALCLAVRRVRFITLSRYYLLLRNEPWTCSW